MLFFHGNTTCFFFQYSFDRQHDNIPLDKYAQRIQCVRLVFAGRSVDGQESVWDRGHR